jgi:hypothetical protein
VFFAWFFVVNFVVVDGDNVVLKGPISGPLFFSSFFNFIFAAVAVRAGRSCENTIREDNGLHAIDRRIFGHESRSCVFDFGAWIMDWSCGCATAWNAADAATGSDASTGADALHAVDARTAGSRATAAAIAAAAATGSGDSEPVPECRVPGRVVRSGRSDEADFNQPERGVLQPHE